MRLGASEVTATSWISIRDAAPDPAVRALIPMKENLPGEPRHGGRRQLRVADERCMHGEGYHRSHPYGLQAQSSVAEKAATSSSLSTTSKKTRSSISPRMG